MISIDVLREIKDLKGLNDTQLQAIHECCTEKEYKKEDRLFKECETASHMWLLSEGEVSLRFDMPVQIAYDSYSLLNNKGTDHQESSYEATSKKNTVSVITKGMSFGWSCFVQPYVYSLSAYCKSDICKTVLLDRDCMLRVFSKDPKIGYLIISKTLNIVGKRFHELQAEVVKRKGEDIMFQW
jgi:CRP-like cAMP-binding protein